MLKGELLIGSKAYAGQHGSVRGINPATNETLEPAYGLAGQADIDRACELAEAAFDTFRELPLAKRAEFLEKVAQNILDLGDELVERVIAETGLPRARVEGERGRTVGQLRIFAEVVREGSWLEARIDPALPERQPLPRSDLRQRHIAVGPVVVFGASNFPLAFSVAGGDTASAFAAGCPVIVKAHSAHPGTSELVGQAVRKAVQELGLPEGVFSLIYAGRDLATKLVADARVKAVGFTGSRGAGTQLMRVAAERAEPIPVYAEMSSINPVYLFPAALKNRAESIGKNFVASLTMGAGQFCTNPGLILAIDSPGLQAFLDSAGAAIKAFGGATMLTPGIHDAYAQGVDRLQGNAKVQTVARGAEGQTQNSCQAGLFVTDAESFLADASLHEEVFGSSSLVVRCRDVAQMRQVTEHLEGQLTAALHIDPEDHAQARELTPLLERKAGRVLVNGFGTGVEVCHAMVHGGPFPSTSDGRTTSVGTLAIRRFLRPVCYQDWPVELLPEALRDGNPFNIPRRLDGKLVLGS